ncbi:amino acid ABC transporter substrate-binding protein [Desulfobacterales bacterium HSG2]|nr:amino acid ABC transporter substrate-binding protein [Desulfobacterales bacterium HSG2]
MSNQNERRFSRREFLKKTATGVAGVAVIGMAPDFSRAAGKKPVKIGASISITGKYARTGQEQRRGYELWAEHINQRGHSLAKDQLPHKEPGLIDGRPVELIVLDDRSDPTTGIRLFTELIYNRGVDLLLGPYSSAVSNAVSPIVEESQIPTPMPLASSPKIWKGKKLQWMPQIQPPASFRLPGVVKIGKDHGNKTIAIIFSDTAFPRAAAEGIKERAEKHGMEVVLYEAYPKTLTDWTPIISKANEKKADILAGGGYLPDSIGIVKAAKSVNYTPHIISLVIGVALPDFRESLGNDALHITGDADWLPGAEYPGAKEFTDEYVKKHGRKPEYHAAAGYGTAQILEEAVKQVGNVKDKKAIRDVMYGLDTVTVFNKYKVMPLDSPNSGLQTAAKRLLLQWQKDGEEFKKVVIFPPEAVTGKLVYPFPGWA